MLTILDVPVNKVRMGVEYWKEEYGQDFIKLSSLSRSPTNSFILPLPLTSSANAIYWNPFAKVGRA